MSLMGAQRLEEFIEGSPLSKAHKEELRQAHDKDKFYEEIIFWYELHDAKKAWHAYRNYIIRHSIFLRPELREVFVKIADIMWNTLISRQVGQQANDTAFWVEASQKVRNEVQPLVEKLEGLVHGVLQTGK